MSAIYGTATYGTIYVIGTGAVVVGNYCSIAGGVQAVTVGHNTRWVTTFPFSAKEFNKKYKEAEGIKGHPVVHEIIIGSDVWIGQNTTFIGNCEVGDGAIIGANSVVRGKIQPYSINIGNPSMLVAFRFSKLQINQLLKIGWWNWDEGKIRANMKLLLSGNIDEFIAANR